jgi:TatD DNase family protein
MTPLVDTHCHLQDAAFAADLDAVVERARAAGIAALVVCGFDPESNLSALEMADAYRCVYPAIGCHPHDADKMTNDALDLLATQAANSRVVAVGEIGLDFYRDLSPRDVQRAALEAQLAIAVQAGKPVSVHSRDAEDAIYPHLVAYARRSPLATSGRPVGVMHCFGGTLEQALSFVEIGFLVSISCTITYPRNDATRRIGAELPMESLVVETDSPYLPPQPIRGKRNEPAHVRAAAEAIAAARGVPADVVATITTENAARLFGIAIEVAA